MGVIITSKKFKAAELYNGDGGVNYLNGVIGQKMILTLEGYFEKTALNKYLKFDSATKTITNYNRLDNTSFLVAGYIVGEKLMLTGTASNPGEFTITAVADTVITVAEAVVDEICENASIFLSSKIDAIDYYYNIKNNPNGTREDFLSLQDPSNLQKYQYIKGFDASDITDTRLFTIGTDSYSWVTDTLTGSTSQLSIIGLGITSYKQKFRIIHTFYQSPLWTKEKFQNFTQGIIPPDFLNNNAPQYIFSIDGKYSGLRATAVSLTDISTPSDASWFNQNNQRTRPDYYFLSKHYVDNADSSVLDRIDFTKTVNCTFKIKSTSAIFAATSKFILEFIYCSLDEKEYQNTQTTLRQNAINDRIIMAIGDAPANGEYYGTDLTVIKGAQVVAETDHIATITFQAVFSANAIAILKLLDPANYNYAFTVTTQNKDTASSDDVDTVNVLLDFQNADLNLAEPNLLYLKDYIHINKFPTVGSNETNDVKGSEGTLFYAEIPFQIETAVIQPTIKSVGMQIVAVKDGQDDFILEENLFNTSQACITGAVQQINQSKSRGYKLFDGSPYNEISLQNNSAYDDGTKKGYLLHYPFCLRYDYWIQLFQANKSNCAPIQKDVKDLSNKWININNGWSLKLRFVAEVIGSNDVVTPYDSTIPITIIAPFAAPDIGVNFDKKVFILDENDNEVNGIIANGKTKIIALYTGDFTNFPDFGNSIDSITGTISLDIINSKGGVNQRRQANSDVPSESDSNFIAPIQNPAASYSWAEGNARVNLFFDGADPKAFTIETIYQDKGGQFGQVTDANGCGQPGIDPGTGLPFQIGGVIIGTNGIPIGDDMRLFEDLEQHLWDDGDPAKWT